MKAIIAFFLLTMLFAVLALLTDGAMSETFVGCGFIAFIFLCVAVFDDELKDSDYE
jgi:hypothetical protein